MAGGNTGSLNSSEALELWWAGRETWNAWVEAHSNDDISFVGVDFSKYRDHPKIGEKNWPFLGFLFPRKTDFSDVNFGDGDVCFAHTRFNAEHLAEGFVDFGGARFGAGKLSFHKANFHAGEVDFGGCYFGDGQLFFDKAEFAAAKICFDYSTFGNGNKFFTGVNVHADELTFIKAEFGDGLVGFESAIFEADFVSFQGASFGDGDVSFYNCVDSGSRQLFLEVNFGKGDVSFCGARFGTTVDFGRVSLGAGQYDFGDAVFPGRADFSGIINAGKPEDLSFRFCVFASGFSLSADDPFNCVPDFVGIKAGHHFSLEGFTYSFASTRPIWFLPKRAKDERDSERLRRLKELATDNRDFAKALDFNAEEIRASRWHSPNWRWKLIPEFVFWVGSDYGRSIGRAVGGLAALWFVCAAIYAELSVDWAGAEWLVSLPDALAFSASQMYGYLLGNRESRVEQMTTLFANQKSNGLFVLTNLQSVFTIIGTFLLGLTLRNRFKM